MKKMPLQKNKRGWWSLEILMSITLCVAVTSAGMITMFQILGENSGLYPKNQLEQEELSRILISLESDFYKAQRVYLYSGAHLQEKVSGVWGDLYSNAHNVTVSSGDYSNLWNINIPYNNSIAPTFLANWISNNANISSTNLVNDTNDYYYTLVFLGGGQTINAVFYLTDTQNGNGVSYTLTRYENNGGRLVQTNNWTYTAPGVTFTTSDQSLTPTVLPSITSSAITVSGVTYDSFTLRLPTAFSTALKDETTGHTARRVKYTADEWGAHGGYWTFVADGSGRWDRR